MRIVEKHGNIYYRECYNKLNRNWDTGCSEVGGNASLPTKVTLLSPVLT